jgi:hypothetical protein
MKEIEEQRVCVCVNFFSANLEKILQQASAIALHLTPCSHWDRHMTLYWERKYGVKRIKKASNTHTHVCVYIVYI